MTGGPPVRGTKLTAWRIPPVWKSLQENDLTAPEGSRVPRNQQKLMKATNDVLAAVAQDVRDGLLETVGVESSLSFADERCSMRLQLPADVDAALVAEAIDLENVEAWTDAQNNVHIGVNPWFSTKDVDQTVLCTIKVIHVLLGVHAADTAPPQTFTQKLLASIAEVMQIQQGAEKNKQ